MQKHAQLLCYHYIREEAERLYGFATADERALFTVLIGISGIGPKAALAVLSSLSPEDLARCVAEGDPARITGCETRPRCRDRCLRSDDCSRPNRTGSRSPSLPGLWRGRREGEAGRRSFYSWYSGGGR